MRQVVRLGVPVSEVKCVVDASRVGLGDNGVVEVAALPYSPLQVHSACILRPFHSMQRSPFTA